MPAPNRTELRTFILARFNRDEFGFLCNDYFPDFYRDYEGVDTPLRNLAEALVAHCERYDQLERLRSAVHAARPQPYEATFGEFIAAEIKIKPRNPRQIFLSYAHQDEAFARRLQADLRAQGVPLWVATSSILPGEKWAAAIDRGLRESGIFAVILTPNALAAKWVKHEVEVAIDEAVNENMRLLPLYVKPCNLKAKFLLLTPYEYIDFTQNYEVGLQKLLVGLGLVIPAPPPVSPPKPEPRLPKIPRRKWLAIGCGTLTLGTVGYGVSRLVTGGGSATLTPEPKPSDTVAPTATALVATSTTPPQPTTAPPTLTPSSLPTATVIRSPTPLPTLTATSTPIVRRINTDRLAMVLGSGIEIEMVRIPKGEFIMGSTQGQVDELLANYTGDVAKETVKTWLAAEVLQHQVTLDEYWLGKTEVTVAQFEAFVKAKGYMTQAERDGKSWVWNGNEWKEMAGANWQHPRGADSSLVGKANHPVTHISWDDAVAFCKWVSDRSKLNVRLPSEAEWEKGARGTDGRTYAWGNQMIDKSRANYNLDVGDTTKVGQYSPLGDSPYGLQDMLGNVWEWTSSLYKPYPYNANDGRESDSSRDARVLRGGSFNYNSDYVRCACRDFSYIPLRDNNIGFRVCVPHLSNL